MAVARQPPLLAAPSGVGIMSISGGCRGILADACARRGVPLAVFDAATEDALGAVIPSFGVRKNPVDPSGAVMTVPRMFETVVRVVGRDSHSEILLIQYGNGALRMVREHLTFYEGLRAEMDKPIVVCSIGDELNLELHRKLNSLGILWASDPDQAVQQCEWLYRARATSRMSPAGDTVSSAER